jgi:energy-coupling factor transporter ATP-binding protein EcfA2
MLSSSGLLKTEEMQSSERLDTEAGALQNIVAWSADRPMWQRDALRRLCGKESFDEGDYEELLAIAKSDETKAIPLKKEHVPSPDAAYKTVNLQSIRDSDHVNALKPGECLSIEKGNGITVIYGDNGSGKSGYARILKNACRARMKEKIRPNIYSTNPGTPQANIHFSVDAQNCMTAWQQGQETDLRLSAISVFDSNTANVHVDEKNEVAYNPFPLELLKRLSEVCKEIQQRLKNEEDELERQTPASLRTPKCKPDTKVGKLIAALNEKTKPNDVTVLGQLSEEEQKRYETLKVDLAADPAATARKLNSQNTQLGRYKAQMDTIWNAARDETLLDVQGKYTDYLAKREAAQVAADSLFKGENLPNIGADTWRMLWDAARRYSEAEAYPECAFPHTEGDARCVLCHQPFSAEAAKRLQSFETFVKDEAKKAEEATHVQYQKALDAIKQPNIAMTALPEMFRFMKDDLGNEALAKALKKCVVAAKWRLRRFCANHAENITTNPLTVAVPETQIQAASQSLTERAAALTNEKNSEERKKLEQEHAELQDRRWLAVVKDDVLAEIERIKERKRLKKLNGDSKTTGVTAKSSELAKNLVTDALRAQFSKETEKLKLGALAVELQHAQSRAGAALFRVSLSRKPDETVSAILSEGEFRCIALAAFMAEQATTESRSTIVFDDPVCSLDHMHREQVAERLAEEAVNRQVVIFTHDLAFLFLLEESCVSAGANISYRWIARNRNDIGLCKTDAPPRARPIEKAIDALANHLSSVKVHYENGDTMKWEQAVGLFERELRILWERAVEESVAPVVKRFRNKVDTKNLSKLTAITVEDCENMRLGYGRSSTLLHSDGDSLNRPLPEPQVIENEINFLKNWIVDIRERQKKILVSS